MSAGTIERVGAVHAKALALIHAASFPPNERWGEDAIALQLGLHGAYGLIDPRGGMLLARSVVDEAEILTLAVMPDQRRRGIAAALLTQATRQAQAQGAVTMFLEVSVRNRPAQALYVGCGFREVGRRRGYYPGGADAIILRRDLGAPQRSMAQT